MTPTHRLPLLLIIILGGLSACPGNQTAPPGPIKSLGPLGSMQSAMVCTSGACAQDTNAAHAAVVFITMNMSAGQASCSGTLAASNVVITAGHCVSQENSSALISANNIDVYFGNSCAQCMYGSCSCTHSAVTAVHRHPSYDYTGPLNDVSVLIIASKPSSVTPIPMLPYASAGSIAASTTVEFSGFGVDNSLQNSGVKLHATNTLNGVCNSSNGCGSMSGIPIEPWVIWYDENPGGPCSGDSGGPAFWKDGTGKEYVIAATSYGDQNCQYMGTSTFLPHFANPSGDNFLLSYVGAGYANGHACTGAADCTNG